MLGQIQESGRAQMRVCALSFWLETFRQCTPVGAPASYLNVKRILTFVLFAASALAADGSFTGQVVNGPNQDANKNWVYVQGPRGPVRRVDVSTAKVRFGAAVGKKDRDTNPEDAVREGAQVRVTASQDGDGEWKASSVEVVKAAPK